MHPLILKDHHPQQLPSQMKERLGVQWLSQDIRSNICSRQMLHGYLQLLHQLPDHVEADCDVFRLLAVTVILYHSDCGHVVFS